MNFLLTLHGELRWLAALVAILAIVRFGLGWWRRLKYLPLDRGLMSAFTIVLDINLLLGLILLFGLGSGFTGYRIEHATTMFVAVLVAHASAAWRRSDDDARKFRNNLIVVLVALAVVFVGVIRLRGSWLWA